MCKKIIVATLAFLFSIPAVFSASGDTIELSASKTQVHMGETFNLRVLSRSNQGDCGGSSNTSIDINAFMNGGGGVTIQSGSGSEIDIAGLDQFSVSGTSESTQCQITNGKTISEQEKQYILTPKKEGKFTLGPVRGTRKKEQGANKTVTIEVLSGSVVSPQSSPNPSFFTPQFDAPVTLPDTTNTADPSENSLVSRIDPLILRVLLVGSILLVAIGLAWRYLGSLDKTDFETEEKSVWWAEEEIVPSFSSLDDAEQFIRDYYARRTGEKTESLTYLELLALESDPQRSSLLRDILTVLERARFAGGEVDMEEVNEMVRKWKENEM